MWQADLQDARGALEEQGVWFGEGAVGAEDAAALREEILRVHGAGLLTQSGNKLAVRGADGQRGGVVMEKPGILEADVIVGGEEAMPEVLERCPTLARLLRGEAELRRAVNAARPELALERLEQAKVAVNVGPGGGGPGGAFPFHFDVSSSKEARRQLTALLYLNPDWQDDDGGEVELLPFPFPDLLVAPVDRRLVVFSSNTTMHRVRPFRGAQSRVVINLWFDGSQEVPFPPPLPAGCYDDRALRVVRVLRRQPMELRAFCKVWYQDAIAASLREAFAPSKELDAAVELHRVEAAEVERRIAPATLAALRECLPLECQAESVDVGSLLDGFDL